MSNAVLAPSASLVAASGPTGGMESFDISLSVKRCAESKLPAHGKTTAAFSLNKSKLVSSVCADIRSHFPSEFGKRDSQGQLIPESLRLPADIHAKVVSSVDDFIDTQLAAFKNIQTDSWKVSSRYVHYANKKDVGLRTTMIKDEIISLQYRKCGIELFIGHTTREIAKLNKQKTVMSEKTEERLRKLEKRLVAEQLTLETLELEIAKQKGAAQA